MSTIEYAVRDAGGLTQRGSFSDGVSSTIYVTSDKDVSLNVRPDTVQAYHQIGDDLHVILVNGQVLILDGFFDEGATGEKNLFVSEGGQLHKVDLTNDGDETLIARYDFVDAGGKWSAFDELVFLDIELIEPVVAPLLAPALGGLGGLAAGGAALVGGAAIIGGSGGGGDNDGGGGGGTIVPTVDDAGIDREVGGTGPDTVTITGTGEPDSTVDVTIGTQTQTTTIDANGVWSVVFDATTLPDDGVYDTSVLVTTVGGTTTTLVGPSVDIDTTAPEVVITSGTQSTGDMVNSESHQNGTVITGTGEVGATVSVEINGTTHSTTVDASGSWSVTFSDTELATGEYNELITITTTDARGNASVTTDNLVVDTVAPISEVGTVAGDDVINAVEANGDVIISGTGEAGATLVVEFQGVSQTVQVGAGGAWSTTYAGTAIVSGTYDSTITVTSTDIAGNSSTATHTVHIDTENSLALDSPIAGDNVINAAEASAGVTLTGMAEANTQVTVTLQGVSHTVTSDGTGAWSTTFTTAEIPSGEYDATITVETIDGAGNAETVTGTVQVDTETSVTLAAPVAGDNVINATEAAAGVTVSGTAQSMAEVQVTLHGVTHTVTADVNGAWTTVFTSAEIPSGEYDAVISVTSTDAAGNNATTTGTVRVDTDTSVSIDATQAGDNVINATEALGGVTLTGTSQPNAQVSVTLAGVTHTVTATSAGTWSSQFTNAEIPPGEYDASISVTATDPAGNTETTTGSVRVDTVTDVTVADGIAGDDVVNLEEAQAGITLNGTAEIGSTVTVTIMNVTRTATVDSNGNWTAIFEGGALPSGEFDATVTVNATDPAGNTDTSTTDLRIDTVAGDVALSQAPIEIDDVINGVERGDGVVITGIATPGLTVTVGLGDATHQVQAGVNGAWSTTFAASEIPTGTMTLPITASITDSAGNTRSVSDTVELDTHVDGHTISQTPIETDDVVNLNELSDGVILTGTTEPGSTVVVQIGLTTHTATVNGLGEWTVEFAATDIPQGEYSTDIIATATDPAGNVSTVTDTVQIDTLISNFSTEANQTADDTLNALELSNGITLNGTTEPGSTVFVTLEGVEREATVDSNGKWTVTFDPGTLPPGTYDATAVVTATDPAGNVETLTETFHVDTFIETPDVDSVTFTGNDVRRLSTTGVFDNFSVNTLDASGQVGDPTYTTDTDPTFGTEFTFNTPISDGTHLVVNAVDDAGNQSSTLLVLQDNATNAGVLGNTGLSQFDIHALNLDYASDTNLSLTESQVQSLSGSSDTLTIHGSSDDTLTLTNASLSNETRNIDGQTYNVYTFGSGETTLIVEHEINVII